MSTTEQTGFHYLIAACVGLCFGALAGGAALFVVHNASAPPSIVDMPSVPPVR